MSMLATSRQCTTGYFLTDDNADSEILQTLHVWRTWR